jgi:hypothetical protein
MRKHAIKILVLLQLLFNTSNSAIAQLEGGFFLGVMQYEGDIGGRFPFGRLSQLNNPTSKPGIALGMDLGYFVNPFLRLRSTIHFGTIYGNDKKLEPLLRNISTFSTEDQKKIERNYNRALEFKSPINELGLGAEIYPLTFLNKNSNNSKKIEPYIFLGIGIFTFNPKGIYIGRDSVINWINLRPLKTEGQGILYDEYDLYSTNIAIGLGFRMAINNKISLAYELNFRTAQTDYLDDASSKYINLDLFDSYFATDLLLRDQAKQLSNRYLYYMDPNKLYNKTMNFTGNPLDLPVVFKNDATRGGRDKIDKDYFYSNSLKVIININNSKKEERLMNFKYRGSVICPKIF